MLGREIGSELDGLERTPGRIRRWRHSTVLALQIASGNVDRKVLRTVGERIERSPDASPASESPVALVFLLSFLQDVLY